MQGGGLANLARQLGRCGEGSFRLELGLPLYQFGHPLGDRRASLLLFRAGADGANRFLALRTEL